MSSYKKLLIISCIFYSLFLHYSIAECKDNYSMPVYYPEGVIGAVSPYIIWYDKYYDRDNKNNVKYRISIKPENGDVQPLLIMPDLYDGYYFYKIPFILKPDKYSYTIERLVDFKAMDSKYFHYRKYPIKGEFVLDDEDSQIDNLPIGRLIEYLKLDKENRLVNGYNFLFYSSASICSFGIGLLFYSVLEFGVISKIIYTIAFTSSAVGLGAAGYYGYKYLDQKNKLRKIIDIGENVSINGSVSSIGIYADFKISF